MADGNSESQNPQVDTFVLFCRLNECTERHNTFVVQTTLNFRHQQLNQLRKRSTVMQDLNAVPENGGRCSAFIESPKDEEPSHFVDTEECSKKEEWGWYRSVSCSTILLLHARRFK